MRLSWFTTKAGLTCLFLCFCAAFLSFGLSGFLLLDDASNLRGLSTIQNSQTFWDYVLSGIASQLGRPIAYFSFALTAQWFPDNLIAIQFTNLVIHFVNGCLLLLLLSRLSLSKKLPYWLIVTIVGIWLLHPINMSSYFYLIQRMTSLAATFSILALLVALRFKYDRFFSFALHYVVWGTLLTLAVFTKENALLVSLLSFILVRFESKWHPAQLLFLLPLALYIGYILMQGSSYFSYAHRPFTLEQRLMTEPLIVLDYMRKIVLPLPGHFSVLFQWTRLFDHLDIQAWLAAGAIGSLVLFSIFGRSARSLRFGLLLYFSSHLLESTAIGLELYFDHRNYLGSVFLIFGLIAVLHDLWSPLKPVLRRVIALAWGVVFLASTVLSLYEWRDEGRLYRAAVSHWPEDIRVVAHYADYLATVGDWSQYEAVQQHLDQIDLSFGSDLRRLLLSCSFESVDLNWQRNLNKAQNLSYFDRTWGNLLVSLADLVTQDNCLSMNRQQLFELLQTLQSNPASRNANPIPEVLTVLNYALGNAAEGLEMIRKGINLSPQLYLTFLEDLGDSLEIKDQTEICQRIEQKIGWKRLTKYRVESRRLNALKKRLEGCQ